MSTPNTTENSLGTILANFIRLQNNSLDTLQAIQTATTSNADTVAITVSNSDGTTTSYTIPSFGYLKGSIDRIDNTIQKLTGFDGSDAYIRMPDGTFKRIYQAALIKNPAPIGNLTVPSKFITENNYFFESMYTPALKVSFDVTPYIPQQESKIYAQRLILNLDDKTKQDYFNNNLKGKNNLDYVQLLVGLQKQNINYFTDDAVLDMPLSIVRYAGDFLVVNIQDREVTNPDGSTGKKRWYLFNKLSYTDNLSLTKDTLSLKIGDRLVKGETMYEIVEIDNSTKYVRVTRLNGYDPFIVGEPVGFYSETFSPKIANVGIGFNEYNVIFFRTVNDEENLISTIYSPGVAFATNDLSTETGAGTMIMKDFYQKNVLDFGNILLSQAKENKISAVDGITPIAPELDPSNFKVVTINDHKLDQAEIDSIRKKQSDKVTLESEITELEKSIDKKKEELNSRKFNSDTERRGVKNELDNLIREKSTKSSLYASIVKELAVIAEQKPAALDTPKFRIRGFFNMPDPQYSEKTGNQSVMQFRIYWRYVRPDGSQNNVQQFDFIDANGQIKKGTYSNLNEYTSAIRAKIYDVGTGKYVWASEDIENPDAVNINQIDIPISKGEKVEFYVISVSEAGWPDNPLLSNSSNVISIDFPTDLATEDEATIALQQANAEAVRVQLNNDLAAKGIDTHLESSFFVGQKYYAHNAETVSSGYYTSEGNVITLLQKLQEYEIRILELENRANRVAGILSIYLIDPDKKTKTAITRGSVIQLFAGYYLDYVTLLPVNERRGAIVNKTYQISLENAEATPLQLISRFPGGIGAALPTTLTTANIPVFPSVQPFVSPYNTTTLFPTTSDSDYNNFRLYDQTPIVQTSIQKDDTNNGNKYATAFYQSGQSKGQYIYSRFKDVGLVNNLYENPITGRYYVPPTPTTSGAVNAETWIWNGTYSLTNVPNGGLAGEISDFCIHTDHPAINPGFPGTALTFNNLQLPSVNIDPTTGYPIAPEAASTFRHAKNVELEASTVNGYRPQLGYYQAFLDNVKVAVLPIPAPPASPTYKYENVYQPVSLNEYPDKFGFVSNDRYLIGNKTCGSYLFLGPSTFNQLNVNGIDARATQELKTGDTNAIVIPVVFQFRMEDYWGPSGGAGAGIIGGYKGSTPPTNLTYGRRIGLDLYAQDEDTFSFDIQVSATYKKTSLSQVIATAYPTFNKETKNIVYDKYTIKTLIS